MTRLTLELPDELARQMSILAATRGCDSRAMALQLLKSSVASLGGADEEAEVLASLSDEEVLAMADLQLAKQESKRLSQLLERNREGELTSDEQVELDDLMQIYYDALLRKAAGLAEAVRRKLREPLSP